MTKSSTNVFFKADRSKHEQLGEAHKILKNVSITQQETEESAYLILSFLQTKQDDLSRSIEENYGHYYRCTKLFEALFYRKMLISLSLLLSKETVLKLQSNTCNLYFYLHARCHLEAKNRMLIYGNVCSGL